MSIMPEEQTVLGAESAGLRMTPEEFDAIQHYDEAYRYELVNGVLVVSPISLPQETGPNEILGHHLLTYKETHPKGSALDDTLPQQLVKTPTGPLGELLKAADEWTAAESE